MAQNTFALMTNLGRAKEAAAIANGTAVVITHIAIGDGTTVPSGGETALYHEVARKAISGHGTVVGASNVAYFDIFLEASEGPYTIREAGLIDQDGDLIAIARYDPPISKPIPSSGQTVEGTIRLEVAFSNIANITIVVDPSFKVELQRLSRLPWVPVISMSETVPPVSPLVGDAYLIPTGATGAWSGHAGKIAEYTVAGWAMIVPPEGHGVSLPDGRIFERLSGSYIEKIAIDAQTGRWNYATAGGSANALVASLTPSTSNLTDGMAVRLRISVENTGPVTLNLNGIGAKPILTQKGQPLRMGDLPAGMIVTIIFTGTSWLLAGVAYSEFKQVLTGDLTLWVRPDGDDNNNGSANNVANAFKTLDGAWNYIVNRFDPGNRTITIRLGVAGTYDGFLFMPYAGQVVVMGDPTAPSDNYIIRCRPGESYVVMSSVTTLDIVNCVLSFTYNGADKPGGEWIVAARQGGQVNLIGCRYRLNNDRASLIINAVDSKCVITVSGSIHIQGGFLCSHFVQVVGGGVFLGGIQSRPASVVLASGQTYNSYFCQSAMSGLANWAFTTFGGDTSPTGFRYSCSLNGVIATNGGGENFLPGSAAGLKETGGQYV